MRTENLFDGIYSIPLAAQLLRVPTQNLRGWIKGYSGTECGPLIPSELEPINNKYALSFLNLIEARFISVFANLGVNVKSIRYMAEEAKRILSHPHPFATEMIFKTDGRTIFMQVAAQVDDQALYDLRRKNFAFKEILEREFKGDVIYSNSGLARAWYPRKEIAPSVMVNPKLSFGAPVIESSGIPTETIYNAFLAEGNDYAGVARWFEIDKQRVKEAVDFELNLRTKTIH